MMGKRKWNQGQSLLVQEPAKKTLEASTNDITSNSPKIGVDRSLKRVKETPNENRITPRYLKILVSGIELFLSNYEFQRDGILEWRNRYERNADGKRGLGGYYHIALFLNSLNPGESLFKKLHPEPNQFLLKRALLEHPSFLFSTDMLERKGLIRRNYFPRPELPSQDLLDQCTVYVRTPNTVLLGRDAVLAYTVKTYLARQANLLPVQAMWRDDRLGFKCILMSGNVEMEWAKSAEIWSKIWPKDWIVMPKGEAKKRIMEYKALRREVKGVTTDLAENAQAPSQSKTAAKKRKYKERKRLRLQQEPQK